MNQNKPVKRMRYSKAIHGLALEMDSIANQLIRSAGGLCKPWKVKRFLRRHPVSPILAMKYV